MNQQSSLKKESKNRIEWIDIARGIAILFVCLGHRDIPPIFSKWIYTFHMPIFFFISGYITKYDGVSFGKFMNKKLCGLVIPYFSLGAVYIFSEWIYSLCFHKEFNILEWLQKLFIGQKIGSSWFIIALLIVEILAFLLHRFNKRTRIGVLFFLVVGGFVLNYFLEEQIIWNIPAALIGILFFESGYFIKQGEIVNKICKHKNFLIFVCVISVVASILSVLFNSEVDMWYLKYGNIPLFLLGAYSGIIIVFLISIFISTIKIPIKKPFIYFGKNTLPIIEFHLFPGYVILETVFYKLFKLQYMNNTLSWNLEGFIYALCVLVMMIPVIEIINRWLPWMGGKKRAVKRNSSDI